MAFRCVATCLLTLGALRTTGRHGVRQLSTFGLSIVLALGAAAGSATFYRDVPLLHALATGETARSPTCQNGR